MPRPELQEWVNYESSISGCLARGVVFDFFGILCGVFSLGAWGGGIADHMGL